MSEEAGAALGRIGHLEVRLARTPREIADAQRLRYRVFYEEMSARSGHALSIGRDADDFDAAADHLIVVDHAIDARGGQAIVATSRLTRNETAAGGFYSQSEFDIGALVARHPVRRFLELGRLCILPSHRPTRVAELMWHALWRYARTHSRDVLFGCGSIEGVDLERVLPLLARLRRERPAPEAWSVTARGARGIRLDEIEIPFNGEDDARRAIPPLLRGYLRLGAYVCGEAVVDEAFGTTDVLMVLPEEAISERYARFAGYAPSAAVAA
jgi:putative hemolysin